MAKRIVRQDRLFVLLLFCSAFGHFALGFIGSGDDSQLPDLQARKEGENMVRVQLISKVPSQPIPDMPLLPKQPAMVSDFSDDRELPEFSDPIDRQNEFQRIIQRDDLAPEAPQNQAVEPLQRPERPLTPQQRLEPENQVTVREMEPLDMPPVEFAELLKTTPREGNSQQNLVNPGSQGARVPPQRSAANKDPVYPAELLSRAAEGRVVLWVTVSSGGTVSAVRVHKTSGHRELDTAARQAVAFWRFTPGTRDGKAEAMDVLVPITFKVVAEKRRRK